MQNLKHYRVEITETTAKIRLYRAAELITKISVMPSVIKKEGVSNESTIQWNLTTNETEDLDINLTVINPNTADPSVTCDVWVFIKDTQIAELAVDATQPLMVYY